MLITAHAVDNMIAALGEGAVTLPPETVLATMIALARGEPLQLVSCTNSEVQAGGRGTRWRVTALLEDDRLLFVEATHNEAGWQFGSGLQGSRYVFGYVRSLRDAAAVVIDDLHLDVGSGPDEPWKAMTYYSITWRDGGTTPLGPREPLESTDADQIVCSQIADRIRDLLRSVKD